MGSSFWSSSGPWIASFMFMYSLFEKFFPQELWRYIERWLPSLTDRFNPYIEITFHEFPGGRFDRTKAYTAIQTYLGENSTKQAKRLKAEVKKGRRAPVLSMDDYEEVTEVFEGIQVWWIASKDFPNAKKISYRSEEERRYYQLLFHKRHRDVIINSYLKHVLEEGKAIAKRNKQQKIFTNFPDGNTWSDKDTMWSSVVFEHPATFDTLAMDPEKKHEIIDDLVSFTRAKEYYANIGKAWKRGYLLYGPPGTGKSSLIAAMANFLHYDVYDLELTAVKDNSELKKLLIEVSKGSIIVIEDIDCSLDVTGKRRQEEDEDEEEDEGEDDDQVKRIQDLLTKKKERDEDAEKGKNKSKITLSGLLNFIDGLWSPCGGERIIVFTTNHLNKLDPALTRSGRMDKHIELSYCRFEAFKILAKNYLGVDSHSLFEPIGCLLGECNMTPADVAENLMPKSPIQDAETCLGNLIKALEDTKQAAYELKQRKEQSKEKKKKKKKRMEHLIHKIKSKIPMLK